MQIGMFDGAALKRITKPVRLIELFAGIGSQAAALKRLGISFEHYRVCEWDKFAVTSYNAIHGTNFKPTDITKLTANDLNIVRTDLYEYMLTYSFPCTDLSIAGKQEGMAKGSGTRSGLLWEVERLLVGCEELPQILVMENVPQVHGKKNMENFKEWLAFLEKLGYKNYRQDLNAKDYGVAQNRDRCIVVSILGDYYYEFPKPIKLEKRLKDYLEKQVDEKYYLSEKAVKGFIENSKKQKDMGNNLRFKPQDGSRTAVTVTSKSGCRMTDNYIIEAGNLNNPHWHRLMNVVLDDNGICTTLNTCSGGNLEPKILEPLAYDEQNKYIRKDGCIGALTTDGSSSKHNNRVVLPCDKEHLKIHNKGIIFISGEYVSIRKLTPLECWRLMGQADEDFYKAKAALNKTYYNDKDKSNSQLYKQAGNSIVVDVLTAIFGQMI